MMNLIMGQFENELFGFEDETMWKYDDKFGDINLDNWLLIYVLVPTR